MASGTSAGKTENTSALLSKIETERAGLLLQMKSLAAREKSLRKLAQTQGAQRLAAAFSRHRFGDVSEAQAASFAKQVSAIGVAVALQKLS